MEIYPVSLSYSGIKMDMEIWYDNMHNDVLKKCARACVYKCVYICVWDMRYDMMYEAFEYLKIWYVVI